MFLNVGWHGEKSRHPLSPSLVVLCSVDILIGGAPDNMRASSNNLKELNFIKTSSASF